MWCGGPFDQGIDNLELIKRFPNEINQLKSEIDLVKSAMPPFDLQAFLKGELTPVFFGSAINNFGVKELLDALVKWAPAPHPELALERIVSPAEKNFSGFVFKIQANMDPKHRDRIAFLRVVSGKLSRGMKIHHLRLKRDFFLSTIVSFMSRNRETIEEAFAGDIIGLPNHGNIQIGDSFSEGETLTFTGIPYFAPEIFRKVVIRNPLKTKQLYKGLQQLGEEGAVQVFRPIDNSDVILGAVGLLQFEVVAARLLNEYGVEAVFEPVGIHSARWVKSSNKKLLEDFKKNNSLHLSIDADGHLAYLAPNRVNLQLVQERWKEIEFHSTREHTANND